MAIFGERDYGSPLGAVDPSAFFNKDGTGYYDYSGFSSRLGFSGFSAASGFSSACGDQGPSFLPFSPTLTYPLNYDTVSGGVSVTWNEASPAHPCGDPVTYEVQYTGVFSRNSSWRTVGAGIPQGTSSLLMDFSSIPATDDAGIRIRAIDPKGLFSPWSSSVTAFTVANHAPNPVTVVYPTGGETLDNAVTVIWQEPASADLDGQEVYYTVDVTPAYSTGEGWVQVPGAEALMRGTISFAVNSFNFPEGADYGVRVTAYDQSGTKGAPQAVGPFIIKHSGTFMVDTLPPTGTLTINNGEPLVKDTRVKLDIFGTDSTTGVRDIRFRNSDEDCWSDWDVYSTEKFWDLTASDGVKRVFVQFRDYAGNTSQSCDCEIVSRILCGEGNATDLQVFNNSLYVSFDAGGSVLQYSALVVPLPALPQPAATAMATLSNGLYVAVWDPDLLQASVYIYSTSYSLVASGITSKILCMAGFGINLYMGLQDGRVLELVNNSAISAVYAAGAPINRLRNSGSQLCAAIGGGGAFATFNGTVWMSSTV